MSQFDFAGRGRLQSDCKVDDIGALGAPVHVDYLSEGHEAVFDAAVTNEIDTVSTAHHGRVKSFIGAASANRQIHGLPEQYEPFLRARGLDQEIAEPPLGLQDVNTVISLEGAGELER